MEKKEKKQFLTQKVQHIDMKSFNAVPIIEQFEKTAFQARNLARAARIYDAMLATLRASASHHLRLRFEFVDDGQGDDLVDPAVERLVTVLSERLGAHLRS